MSESNPVNYLMTKRFNVSVKIMVNLATIALVLIAKIIIFETSVASANISKKKTALIIGQSAYQHPGWASLNGPDKEARKIGEVLRQQEFDVTISIDETWPALIAKLTHFMEYSTIDAEQSVFFFSGHGVIIKGFNFLLPIDFNISPQEIENILPDDMRKNAIDVRDLAEIMYEHSKNSVLFLNACQSSAGDWRQPREGLGLVSLRNLDPRLQCMNCGNQMTSDLVGKPNNHQIYFSFSASRGSPAYAALPGESYTPYGKHLLINLHSWRDVASIHGAIAEGVRRDTDNRQFPGDASQKTRPIYLAGPPLWHRPWFWAAMGGGIAIAIGLGVGLEARLRDTRSVVTPQFMDVFP